MHTVWSDYVWLALINFLTPLWPFLWSGRLMVTAGMAAHHNWLLVTLVTDISGLLGMIPYYLISRRLRNTDWMSAFASQPIVQRWMSRLRKRLSILLTAMNVMPLPDLAQSFVAGVERYPLGRFLSVVFVGRLLHILPITLTSHVVSHNSTLHRLFENIRASVSWLPLMWIGWTIGALGGILMVAHWWGQQQGCNGSTKHSRSDDQ